MTIDDYIEERNAIQLMAEPGNSGNKIADRREAEAFASTVWTELGVANRHIGRVLNGDLRLEQVEPEIQACLRRVKRLYGQPAPNPR